MRNVTEIFAQVHHHATMKQRTIGGGDTVYGLGIIGAVVYFVSHATSFWIGVLGVLKAIIWPAFLVFKLLEFFKM